MLPVCEVVYPGNLLDEPFVSSHWKYSSASLCVQSPLPWKVACCSIQEFNL